MSSVTYYDTLGCYPAATYPSYADALIGQCYSTHAALSVYFRVYDCPDDVWHIATYSDTACDNVNTLDLTNYEDCFTSHNGTITAVRFVCGPVPLPSAAATTSSPASTNLAVTATSSPIPASSSPAPPISSPATVTSAPSTSQNPISAGAIAGIVIGAIVAIGIIAGLFTMICLRERRRHRDRHSSPENPSGQTQASPPSMQQYTHSAPTPSAASKTPLTQSNIAAISPRSEVLPDESVSQINVAGQVPSHGSPTTYPSGSGSITGSQNQSSVGPLLSHQYPIGAAAFPTRNPPSVMTPGSAFGSMPPVHAPSVASNSPPE